MSDTENLYEVLHKFIKNYQALEIVYKDETKVLDDSVHIQEVTCMFKQTSKSMNRLINTLKKNEDDKYFFPTVGRVVSSFGAYKKRMFTRGELGN